MYYSVCVMCVYATNCFIRIIYLYIIIPERRVIKAKALIAPIKTVNLGCFIAIIAAIKKVLSPNSETTMTDKDATNACRKPRLSLVCDGIAFSGF